MMSNACAMNERILLFDCTSRRAEVGRDRERKKRLGRQCQCMRVCV